MNQSVIQDIDNYSHVGNVWICIEVVTSDTWIDFEQKGYHERWRDNQGWHDARVESRHLDSSSTKEVSISWRLLRHYKAWSNIERHKKP